MILTESDIAADNRLVAAYIHRWRRYALSFHIEALQADKYWYPTVQQYDLCKIRDTNKYLCIKAGRGVGKTAFLTQEVVRFLICFRIPGLPVKVPLTGPSGGQIDDVSWAEMDAVLSRLVPWLRDRFVLTSESLYCKELPKNWFASPRTAKKENPGTMQGQHGSTLNIYDEGTHVPDEIFNISVSSMTQEHTHAIIACNPDRKTGYVARIFNTEDSWWAKYTINCFDCRNSQTYEYPYFPPEGGKRIIKVKGLITDQWFIRQEQDLGVDSPLWNAFVLGEFSDSESNSMILANWIERAKNRGAVHRKNETLTTDSNNNPYRKFGKAVKDFQVDHPRLLCVDPGQERDPSGIVIRWGVIVEHCDHFQGLDPVEVAESVIELFDSWKKLGRPIKWIVVDSIGIGAGVLAYLRKKKYPAIGVKANNKAPNIGTRCKLMKDWLWWQMRSFFRDQKIIFADDTPEFDRLAEELVQPTFKMPMGKVQMETKDELKKRGVKSPNLADALALSFKMDYEKIIGEEKRKEDLYRKNKKKARRRRKRTWLTV